MQGASTAPDRGSINAKAKARYDSCPVRRAKANARCRDYNSRNPWLNLHRLAKVRANAKGLDFNITKVYLEALYRATPVCPILAEPLSIGEGGLHDFSPTLDRIDNSQGYIIGNVQVISYLANRMKSNATQDQLIRFAKWVLTNNETTCNVRTTETS